MTADLPAGGGLSSSAALEVATAIAVETLCGRSLDPLERALLCQRAECESAAAMLGCRSLRDVTPARWAAGAEVLTA